MTDLDCDPTQKNIESAMEDFLREKFNYKDIVKLNDVSGGLVNKAAVYVTESGKVFVKHSARNNAYDMFVAEEAGLNLIAETGCIRTPKPYKVAANPTGGAVFVMEYLEGLEPVKCCWEKLGQQLAKLHLHNLDLLKKDQLSEGFVGKRVLPPVEKFGFHLNTFFGPHFAVPPVWTDTWPEYFVRHLVQPQFEFIEKDDKQIQELWSELQLRLHRVFDGIDLKPSLVHGDFCSINVGQLNNDAVLFDPCCLYAPAEFDMTILAMENDFPPSFFEAYHSAIPRAQGHDRLIKTQLLFAYLLCYSNSPENRQMAVEIGRELLTSTAAV